MSRKYFLSLCLFIVISFFSPNQLYAQEEEGEIITISERVGEEIDKEEREEFDLFPDIIGFQSVVLHKLPDNTYFFEITRLDEQTGELKIERVQASEESINNIRYHIDIKPWEIFEKPQTLSADSGETQVHEQKYLYSNPGVSIYLELLGKGFYSINIDNRRNRSKAISFGFSVVDIDEEWQIMPSIMFYEFSGAKYRTELGIGLTSSIEENSGITWICVNGVVGYRYQQKNGLLFRIGFTPFLGYAFDEGDDEWDLVIFPSFGISLGYSF